MTVQELARKIGAQLTVPGKSSNSEVARVYAGDRMSDLLEQASAETLLVTRLANPHLFRMAELMDVPGICLIRDRAPEPELLQAAAQSGTALLLSPAGLEETCRELERCLRAEQRA